MITFTKQFLQQFVDQFGAFASTNRSVNEIDNRAVIPVVDLNKPFRIPFSVKVSGTGANIFEVLVGNANETLVGNLSEFEEIEITQFLIRQFSNVGAGHSNGVAIIEFNVDLDEFATAQAPFEVLALQTGTVPDNQARFRSIGRAIEASELSTNYGTKGFSIIVPDEQLLSVNGINIDVTTTATDPNLVQTTVWIQGNVVRRGANETIISTVVTP